MKRKITFWILYIIPFFILKYAFDLFNLDTYNTDKYNYDPAFMISHLIGITYKLFHGMALDPRITILRLTVIWGYIAIVIFAFILIYLLILGIKKNTYTYAYIGATIAFVAICLVATIRFFTGGGNCGFFTYSCYSGWHWEWNSYGDLIGVRDIRNYKGEIVPSNLRGCEYHGKIDSFNTIIMKYPGMRLLRDDGVVREYVFPEGNTLLIEKNKRPLDINIEPFSFELQDKIKSLIYQSTTCVKTFEEQEYEFGVNGVG